MRLSRLKAGASEPAPSYRGTELMLYLDTLPMGTPAVIEKVEQRASLDPIATRLAELGFVPGEAVQVVATGPMGRDPIAVRLGTSRFALRRGEAARVGLRTAS